MSEPMGCSDRYCQESAIPCLETVSEEARRHIGNYIVVDSVWEKIKISSSIFQLVQMATICPITISVIPSNIPHRKVGTHTTIERLDPNVRIA